MASMVTSVKSLNDALKDTLKTLAEIKDTIKHISGPAQSAADTMRKTVTKNGQKNLGKGGKVALGTDGASVTVASSGTNTGNSVSSGTGPQSAAQGKNASATSMPWMTPTQARIQRIGGVVQMAAGVVGAGFAMAPDLGTTVARAGNYFTTAQFSPTSLGYKQLQTSTLGAINRGGRGVSGAGDDAAAAAILAQQYGYAPGSSAYLQSMREVGGAYRSLNMSNASAATAIGGLQTGAMGANLYQYGISQFDKNGNPVSESSMAKQLFNRIFQGRGKGNAKGVQQSLQYGLAGADLNALGFSSDQQALFKTQFMNLAQGKSANLATATGAGNPAAAQQTINASNTNLMQSTQDSMIKGFQHAADTIVILNKKMGEFGQAIAETKGYIQGLGQSGAGGAFASLIGGFTSGIKNIVEAMAILRLTGGGKGAATGIVSKAKGWFGTAFNFVKKNIGKIARIGAAGAEEATLAASEVGTGGLDTPAVLAAQAGVLATLHGGSSYGGFGASFGAKGGGASTSAYSPQYAAGSVANTSAMHPNSGQSSLSTTSSPIPGVAPTTMYGAKDPGMWNGAKNYHTGDDYAVPVGTSVKAVAAGTVFDDSPGVDFGVSVQIDHGNGYQTLYGHLQSKSVKIGEQVAAGQEIGKSGQSGNVTGPHLHFEVRKGHNNPVDPASFMTGTAGSQQTVSGKQVTAPGTVLGTGDQQSWAKDFLKGMGAPTTSTNIKAMTTWMAYEGGQWHNSAHYNPLNTTLGETGAQDMNGAGVKSYGSYAQGLQANVSTLKENQKGYAAIRAALMKGNDLSGVLGSVNHSAWGTHIKGYGGGTSGFGASISSAAMPGMGVSSVGTSGASNNTRIEITLNIQQASNDEAVKFAKRVQSILEENNSISMMGTN